METTVKQRLIAFIKHLRMGQAKFEKSVGFSNGYINNIAKSIGSEKLQKILEVYPQLSHTWLLTGQGEMLVEERDDTPEFDLPAIKYYPNVDGSMGGMEFLDNPDETVQLMHIPGYTDCTLAINAYGDSMSPLINSGEIVLLSEWQERFFDWGKIYLIITRNGYRTIKRIYPSDTKDHISCRSENAQLHPPFDIPLADITCCYLVKGWIRRETL